MYFVILKIKINYVLHVKYAAEKDKKYRSSDEGGIVFKGYPITWSEFVYF